MTALEFLPAEKRPLKLSQGIKINGNLSISREMITHLRKDMHPTFLLFIQGKAKDLYLITCHTVKSWQENGLDIRMAAQ